MFLTNRHKGLERAIANVYPGTHHGNCMFHLSCNVKLHFGKNKHVHMAFYQAAKAYLDVDFEAHMRTLEAINIRHINMLWRLVLKSGLEPFFRVTDTA